MRNLVLFLIIFFNTVGVSYSSTESQCPKFYHNDTKPILYHDTIEICMDKFVVEFSKTQKSPLWSAEKLTRNDVIESRTRVRVSRYYKEKRLPIIFQSSNSDYEDSGYDKGHLTPFKDQAMSSDINSLANIVPQSPKLNRIKWEQLESRIRVDAMTYGELFIITVVIFNDDKKIGNKIPVPSLMYKVVYYPSMTKVFVADNKDNAEVYEIPISTLKVYTGIEF